MTTHDAFPPALEHHVGRYVDAMNAGDAVTLHDIYTARGVVVPRPGYPLAGADRVAATEHVMGLGVPMEARLRHAYVVDDIALLVVDWSFRGTAPDGTSVDMSGTAADVVRRDPDGTWRYLVDNPFGTT
jgi:ketosteroid isomerase-like protein